MSIEKALAAVILILLPAGGALHAQGGGATPKIRTASFRTWEPGLFDPPVLSPAAPWRPGDRPDAVRGPLPRTRDGALGSAAVAVGEFQWEATDLVVRGRGPDFVLARKYRSKSKVSGALGPGWTHAYELRVERVGPDLVLHDGWGRRDLFELEPDGLYGPNTWTAVVTQEPDGSVRVRLGPLGNVWCFSDPDQPVPAAGKLTRIEDQYGNALTFAYDPNGHLDEVVDTLGRTIDFMHDAQGRLVAVTDFAGRTVQYEFYAGGENGGSPGDLKSATSPAVLGTPTGNDFPAGKTTVYTYTSGFRDAGSNHNLTTIRNPDGTVLLRNRYGTGPTVDGPRHWLVAQWLAPDAHEFQLHYSLWRSGMMCIVNDQAGNVREYLFDERRWTVKLRRNTGRANPDAPTTPTGNRPGAPLRPGEGAFLTTWRLNADGRVLVRRDEGNGEEARVEIYRYELPGVDRTRHANVLQYVNGASDPGVQPAVQHWEYSKVHSGPIFHTLPDGQVTQFVRDPQNGALLSIVHAEPGVVEDFEYNTFGQLTTHVHPDNGNGQRQRDEYEYFTQGPSTGYLRWVRTNVDHAPSRVAHTYDLVGNLTSTTDPDGNTTQHFVNALGQVVRTQEPDLQLGGQPVSISTDYVYDENDDLVLISREGVDENGAPQANARWDTALDHDERGRVVSVVREIEPGQHAATNYEFLPARVEIQLPRTAEGLATHVVTEEYDERGLLFRRTRGAGHPTDESTAQWDYDAFGDLARLNLALERGPDDICLLRDALGRVTTVTDAMGNVQRFEYDGNGNRTHAVFEGELIDVPGQDGNLRLREARWDYDDMNRLTGYMEDWFDAATQEPTHTGQYHFLLEIAGTGAVTQLTDAAGEVWTWTRDLTARSTTRMDPTGQTVRLTRDARGNVMERLETIYNQLTTHFEAYPTVMDYDAWNRLVEVRDVQLNTWRRQYDSRNLPVVDLGPSGSRIERTYDGRGLLLEERVDLNGNGQANDAADSATTYTYDLAGNRISRTDDNGHTTTYNYDSLDRHVQTIQPDATSWVRMLDAADRPIQVVDSNGTVVGQQFDALDRLTVRTVQPGAGVSSDTLREDYAYDGLSRLVQASDDDSNVTLVHSSLSHVVQQTSGPHTTTSDHDALGNLVACTYPSGRQMLFSNDALGRVTSVSEGPSGPVLCTLMYAGEHVVRRDLANGVRTDFEFDGIGNMGGDLGVRRMARALHGVIGGATITDLEWRHRGDQTVEHGFDGRLLTADDLQRDVAARLTQWDRTLGMTTSSVMYGLDGLGNRTLVSGGPDAGAYFMDPTAPDPADFQQSQYTDTPFDTRLYDDNGNLTVVADAGSTAEATYDYRGQLVEWADSATGQVHRYTYDALGRMTGRLLDANGAAIQTDLRYHGAQLVEEQGPMLRVYGYEGAQAHAFERREGSTSINYLRDRHDTVRCVVDDTGAVQEYYEYDPFGIVTIRDGAGTLLSESRYSHMPLFRGMRWHEELGLYRDARSFHDPRTGRAVDGAPSSADDREPGLPGVVIYSDFNFDSAGVVDGADFNALGLGWQNATVDGHPDFGWIPVAEEPRPGDVGNEETLTVGAAQALTVGAAQAADDGPGGFPAMTIAFDLRGSAAAFLDEDPTEPFQLLSWSWGEPATDEGPYLRFELQNAQITSFSTHAGSYVAPGLDLHAPATLTAPYHLWELRPAHVSSYSIGGNVSGTGFIIGQLWNDAGTAPGAGEVRFDRLTLKPVDLLVLALNPGGPPAVSFPWSSGLE